MAHALGLLNIPKDQDKILLVNGRGADGETILSEGDVLVVFPLIEGG